MAVQKSPVEARLKKILGKDSVHSLSDELNPYITTEYFDTGVYILNAILSDMDIYKGLPVGKRVGIAGPSGVGKSYFTLNIIKRYLEQNPTAIAVVFESEYASLMEMAENIKLDMSRTYSVPVETLEDFKTKCVSLLVDIEEQQKEAGKNKDEIKYIMCVDSLGMMPSTRELENAKSDKHSEDMGHRAKVVKSIFRNITLKLGLTKTPMLVCNHSYSTLELYSKERASSGSGYQYAIDVGLICSKAQEKDGDTRTGSIITLTIDKHRLVPEGQKFKVNVSFQKGLHPYSNMITFAEEFGIIKKEGRSFLFKDGSKVRCKEVGRNIEKYFTKDIMDELRDKIKKKCSFGNNEGLDEVDDIEDEEE
jgi:RecA/RadA recombinase